MTRLPPTTGNQHYRGLLGEAAWQRLHPAIRRRFSQDQTACYQGIMQVVHLSMYGHIIANICRLLGTPIPYLTGNNIRTKVCVYFDHERRGYTWDRHYQFAQKEIKVHSTKCVSSAGGVIEYLNAGFGMLLKVSENDGCLNFISQGYFWQAGERRIKIPKVLSPGTTIVRQSALNDRQFRFEFMLKHPVFGLIACQSGIFQ